MGMAHIQDAGNGAKSNDIIFKQFFKKNQPSLPNGSLNATDMLGFFFYFFFMLGFLYAHGNLI